MFTDMSSPRTLTEIKVIPYSGCAYTMTASATVTIGDVKYFADLITYTFLEPTQSLVLTWHYPDVTLATLSPSQTLVFVRPISSFTGFWVLTGGVL